MVESDGAAFAQPTAVIGELHANLVAAGGDRVVGLDGELLDAENVVHELGFAVLGVQAPAAETAALGDDHATRARLGAHRPPR